MRAQNWSMTILGYRRHQRRAAAMVGVSNMSTHNVMRFAEALSLYTGWLHASGSQPQLEGVRAHRPTWVALAELFADRRIAMTEGVTSGSLVFVAAVPAAGQPPTDRPLAQWADEQRLPWVEVVDNEIAYWGGLDDAQSDRLMAWFCCQRPLDGDWRTTTFDPPTAARLRAGLFDHGWTRNLELVRPGKKPTCELWGGVHQACILDHRQAPVPSQVHDGVRLTLADGTWTGKDIADRCALSDETGKIVAS
ncbi:MAG TPA: hypothetical protein VEL07_04370 [Planctomycetota bacterium]|nr:hypothetical protein [Planctomycetota bacterium]